jgi:hypothetical protein
VGYAGGPDTARPLETQQADAVSASATRRNAEPMRIFKSPPELQAAMFPPCFGARFY